MSVKNEFIRWYETLPNGRVKEVKAEIIRVCIINDTIFKNWKSGKTAVPRLAYPLLNQIALRESNSPIYDSETTIQDTKESSVR